MSSLQTTDTADQTLGAKAHRRLVAAEEARLRVRVVLEELWHRLDGPVAVAIAACLPDGVEERPT